MRVDVMADWRSGTVNRSAVNARFLEILKEMMHPVRRRCREKRDEERDDSQCDVRSRINGNCFHGYVFKSITAQLLRSRLALRTL